MAKRKLLVKLRFELLKWSMHDVLDAYVTHSGSCKRLAVGMRSYMTKCIFNCHQDLSLKKVPKWKLSVRYFTEKTPFDRYGRFLRSFSRKKTSSGYCFLETNIL
jgi:hypothetical protein